MATFLFNDIIVGPIRSRRMGLSLGVNLLPTKHKFCNFDCIYCECGFNQPFNGSVASELPSRTQVIEHVTHTLQTIPQKPDAITFAGNGEPTIHPEFAQIIDDVIQLRNTYSPQSEVVVLTNATQLHKTQVFNALQKVDRCMLKLDSAIPETIAAINQPANMSFIDNFIHKMQLFKGKKIIQTMFLRGVVNGKIIDNTTNAEIDALIDVYKRVQVDEVFIYSIQRDTPVKLETISNEELTRIAQRIQAAHISVTIS
ncbi:MAG: radical SAM protein [Bacteroidales bacterium]|jgi:wyosine [tRNA(Phe)-imidazoG37] synthetase (radical SAM superfamily)|nr:radical SAM protein [Bacteroidales bacterium]